MTEITNVEIEAKRTRGGGWTRETLAAWGVPWPPPKGWRNALLAFGLPYVAATAGKGETEVITREALEKMVAESKPQLIAGEPFGVDGQLDIDPAKLLRKVVSAVISAGHAADLYEFPDVLAFFNARLPAADEIAGRH